MSFLSTGTTAPELAATGPVVCEIGRVMLRLVERFTRRDADTLDYSVVVDDPQTWTRSWTVSFSLTRDAEYRIYEYACHEGNYAIPHMLRGFRAVEAGR